MREILIEPGAFVDLCASAIETYNRECTGFLLGKCKRGEEPGRRLKICSAHPQQTARRKPTSVEESDGGGVRTRKVLRALSYMRGVALVGGYHSHPSNECGISMVDVKYALDELREAEKSGYPIPAEAWLELIVAIRKRKYVLDYSPELFWNVRYSQRKIHCLIQTAPRVGYHLTIGAFWVWEERGKARHNEAKVRISR
ncbi:MAG: hypothetical protein V1934_00895 [Methanobacteriota archaeon]